MKIFSALMVNLTAAFTALAMAPAAQAEVSAQPSALMPDLPLTPGFAAALADYRDCVLSAVDHSAIAAPQAMAMNAMETCSRSHDTVRAQLFADIRAQNPAASSQSALSRAESGMQAVEPIVAQVAQSYAREQIGQRVQ